MAINSPKEHISHLPKWAQRLLYIFSALIILWLVIYIAFRTPAVQSYLTGLAEDKVSTMINTKVSIGGIDIDFLDQIILEEVYIEDQQGDTLLYSGRLDVAFDPWAAVNKTISIDHVIIADTYINLYQLEGTDTLNFEFIPEAFASDTTTQTQEDTTSSSWNIQANELLLSNIRFDYNADSTMMHLALNKLNLLFDKIAMEEQVLSASELDIDGLAFRMQLPATPSDTTGSSATSSQEEADTTDSNVINPSGYTFEFGEIMIANSKIGYQVGQVQNDSTTRQMNFENLALADIQLEVENVLVGAKEVSLDLPLMAFTEANSGFRLEELAAQVRMDMPSIALTLNELRTAYSEMNGNVEYGMRLSDNTAELMNSISLDIDWNETILGMQDVSYFSDALSSYPAISDTEAQLNWRMSMQNGEGVMDLMELTLADQARLVAEASFKDLGALDSSIAGSPYFNFNLNEFSTDYAFLSSILDDSTAQYLKTLNQKNLLLTAQVEGTLEDIEGNANLETGIGRLLANGSYQASANGANIKANLDAKQFDIKAVMLALGNPDSVASEYGNLSMVADLEAVQSFGQDTSLSSLNANILVQNFGYKGYQYEGLKVDAQKRNDAIEASIDYEDSLLQMHANAQANLNEEDSEYQMEMSLENANLFRLNLVEDSIIINNTHLQAEAQGNTLDNIVGTFKVTESSIIRGKDGYELDSLVLVAENSAEGRSINFYSDYIDAGITGQFSLAVLPTAIEEFRQYYMSAYEAPLNKTDTINTDETNQELFVNIDIRETPIIAKAFMPSLNIAQPISANAYFNSNRKKLTFRFYAPNVIYQDYRVDSLLFTAQTSQKAIRFNTKSNYIAIGDLTIPEVLLRGNLSGVKEDSLEEDREQLFATQVDLNLKVGAEDAPYRLDLNTILNSSQDTISVKLNSSELVLEEEPWEISPNASILYANNFLEIDSFYLRQDEQIIQINTNNEQQETNLQVLIDQLAIGPLLASLDMNDYMIGGSLNVEASLQNLFNAGDLESNLTIDDLVVRDMPVGTLELMVSGENLATPEGTTPLQMQMNLNGSNNELALEGNYRLDSGYFDFDVNMERFQLDPWQTFMQDYVEELEGVLQANLQLQGTASDPSITGNFTFADEVSLIPSITGAQYYINNQTLEFNGDELVFNEFTILDSARTEATIDGNISFADLSNPVLNLAFDTDNFQFVNSENYQNESFYGRVFATAFLEIVGEVDNLNVTGDVSVNEGTDMIIAMVDEAGEAAQAEYIQFVDATGGNAFLKADTIAGDSTAVSEPDSLDNQTLEIRGFSLSTNISISPEAQFTIIIDPVNGDQITASGEGELNVSMSPTGEMNMQGTYILEDGAYVLTFAQVVKKEFQIREGSTLTWAGDPANARFDITAVYTAETTVDGMLTAVYQEEIRQSGGGSYITTEQPVNVLMNISGELTEPELSFDIEIPELEASGMSAQIIQNLVEQMQQDETQLYKQVFALIVLNRFLPVEGGFGSGGGGSPLTNVNQKIDQSLSRMLSSTLTNLGEDYLGGVQIDLNLESDELQAQNTALADRDLNLQVSKQFFSDRLTISAGGMTSLNTNSSAGAGGASDNQFYGEFEVLYRLDDKGNLNIRIFQNSERDIFTNEVDIRQGFSLRHQKTFDKIFEDDDQVLRSRPNSEEDEENDEEKEEQSSKGDTALDNAQRHKRNRK
ncbi:translocation/assembly module TamB domain-containing protein [Catalinimonas niigatensis]|uniref:translocation/assembly module TamB domain-containing protein n=1 Tax=Catalinimonas niigatensis TaxID=1397264 RepID=UPI002665C8D9|nr:translocation/assembly module TamB domain-containing protein [Catalinimonas niigatensis]WPP48139.1 translocation/assembly module TamB domain-containing protein [Catalinimonas niigatensis]